MLGTRQVGGNSEVMSCPMAKKPVNTVLAEREKPRPS